VTGLVKRLKVLALREIKQWSYWVTRSVAPLPLPQTAADGDNLEQPPNSTWGCNRH